ncbi:MAG: hybrid sensor histidine kinase/response regulator, partial [Anaerolineae bacterium]
MTLYLVTRHLRLLRQRYIFLGRLGKWLLLLIVGSLVGWSLVTIASRIHPTPALEHWSLMLLPAAGISMIVLFLLLLFLVAGPFQHDYRLLEQFQRLRYQAGMLERYLPDIFFTLDAEGLVQYVPLFPIAIVGYEPADVLHQHFLSFVAPASRELAETVWNEIRSTAEQRMWMVPLELRTKEGPPRSTVVTLFPRWDKAGHFRGVDGIIRGERSQRTFTEILQKHTERLNQLFELALDMGSSMSLEDLLNRVLDIAQHAVGYDSANIFVRGADGRFRCVAARGYVDPKAVFQLDYEQFAGPQLEQLQRTLQPMIYPDITQVSEWKWIDTSRHIRAWMGAPLVVQDTTIGVINLNSRLPGRYTEEDARVMASIASHAAAAVHRAALFQQVQEQAGRLRHINARLLALQEAGLHLAQATTIPELMERFREIVGHLVPLSHQPIIALANKERGMLEVIEPAVLPPMHLEAMHEVGLDSLVEHRREIVLTPALEDVWVERAIIAASRLEELPVPILPAPLAELLAKKLPAPKSFIQCPLFSREHLIGVLTLFAVEETISEDTLEFLKALSNMLAVALDNLCLMNELREARQQLDNAIASSNDAFIIVSKEGKILTWNPAAERIFGYPAELALDKPMDFAAIPSEELKALVQRLWEQVLKGACVTINEEPYTHPDGRRLWLDGAGTPVFDAAGRLSGALFVVRDVTRERIIKRQMEQTERLSALGQIVAGVAHELNNPLTSVIGFGQLLLSEPLRDEARRDVERIVAQARRMTRIVQNLLVFAREREPEWTAVDLNAVIRQVIEMREHELTVGNIQVELELAEDLPIIRADPYQLGQVFFNLVLNAEQAMAEAHRGGRLTVRAQLTPDKAWVRAEVIDDGPGIPPQNLKRIFEPFFTTKDVGKGTGLGLSVCHGIVEEHGGRIWAESEYGKGAAFIVELPARPAPELIPSPAPPTAVKEEAPALPRRILLVDDEDTIASMLQRVLPLWGYQVNVAEDGQEALRRLAQEEYDLILCDIRMPGLTGQDVMTILQEKRPECTERIVFMTGDTVSADTQAFLREVGRPVLRKPFTLELLQELLG